jgi:hypothetical protein
LLQASHNHYSKLISTFIDQGLNFDLGLLNSLTIQTTFMEEKKAKTPGNNGNRSTASDKETTANKAVDPNTIPAAEQAADDISQDPDLAPDESDTADLDEGELARVDNSND